MKPIIEVQNLSKRYKLGVFNAKTLREEAEAFLARFGRKKAELAGGGSQLAVNSSQVTRHSSLSSAPADEFWALRDVSFDVQPGEVIGVIGRNGAGKSTLLKILSRITEPTSGEARIRGRVASLLEVGTGFHAELTGRENVFLNGAILGMTKQEIRNKFDEIVAFAEIEKFIDTPVKRYSSGMYVRLAFAVAAHLEPEILIVDEVLAVGDVQFQKKCLGKMQEVSGKDGRTVLFVSHNMAAVKSLCSRGICLQGGEVVAIGDVVSVVQKYTSAVSSAPSSITASKDAVIEFRSVCLSGADGDRGITKPEPITFAVTFLVREATRGLRVGYALHDSFGVLVNGSANHPPDSSRAVCPGLHTLECCLRSDILTPGDYSLTLAFDRPPYTEQILRVNDALLIHLHGKFNPSECGAVELSPVWTDTLDPGSASRTI
jgi:lipopolysaccharide transport system ATP-binding protein